MSGMCIGKRRDSRKGDVGMAQLNKTQFCKVLRDMQNFVDCRDETDRLYQKYHISADAYGGHEYLDAMTDVLTVMFDDEENFWIHYWIWEKDFGRQFHKGDIKIDGIAMSLSLSTPEELYDFLTEGKRKENHEKQRKGYI